MRIAVLPLHFEVHVSNPNLRGKWKELDSAHVAVVTLRDQNVAIVIGGDLSSVAHLVERWIRVEPFAIARVSAIRITVEQSMNVRIGVDIPHLTRRVGAYEERARRRRALE